MNSAERIFAVIVLSFGLLAWKTFNDRFSFPQINPNDDQHRRTSYDFIIVGAGSAGSVLANRLSADPSVNVLLIEAGGTGSAVPYAHVPGLVASTQLTPIDWQYRTVPQQNACLGIKDQESRWPRGKVLGGTSVLNYMLHVRGRPEDYDRWERDYGLTGWGWNDVLPYYKKLESIQDIETDSPDYRGTTGPIKFGHGLVCEVSHTFLRSARQLGYNITQDYNGQHTTGFGLMQTTVADGLRQSTYQTYLEPIKNRPNLDVLMEAQVIKITLNEKNDMAVGVEYEWRGEVYQAVVGNPGQVILSGGTIGSPQMLMLSGIGPKEHLAQMKIPIRKDLSSVGQNLQDHVMSPLLFKFNQSVGIDVHSSFLSSIDTLKNYYQYFVRDREGILGNVAADLNGFFHSGVAKPATNSKSPDIQLFTSPTYLYADLATPIGLKQEVIESEKGGLDVPFAYNLVSSVQQPMSRGRLVLTSNNHKDHPKINPNYLNHPRDVQVILKGMKILLDVMKSNGMAHLKPEFAEEPIPSCRQFEILSDEYLECSIRHKTYSLYHPTSTCRMGKDPKQSVVDPKFRVHGMKNLRIVDASVFPDIVSGNTNLPTIMLAEKAADMIIHNGSPPPPPPPLPSAIKSCGGPTEKSALK